MPKCCTYLHPTVMSNIVSSQSNLQNHNTASHQYLSAINSFPVPECSPKEDSRLVYRISLRPPLLGNCNNSAITRKDNLHQFTLEVVELEDMMLITSVHFQCPRNDPQHAAAKHDERLGPVQLVHSGEPQNPDANGRRGERASVNVVQY